MNRHLLSYSKLAAGFLIGSLAASPALTQGMLEEVIVTAQKREQSLQDVPIAVSAFTGEMLERAGVKDMFDLQVNAPSLIVSQSQTSTTSTFSIRGVFTSSQNFGLESSVGLYVDGVYRARQGSMINNLLDVASVEVLRGPQGTLFGRNTPAGAVQINSV
ncbi:MAG: TonB-dependent receptor plug domain-containing protein, partial [Halioglobus sp.]|nr:TonB-dependent receptor plug domain-containing protein [Halioglobus sp.]